MHHKPKTIEKACPHHGTTVFVLEGRGSYRCRSCRSEAVSRRRKTVKRLLVEAFGGKCQIPGCGYDKCIEALEFHHLDRATKSFAISEKGHTVSFDRALAEARKCVLVCANCHAEIESGVTQVPEGFTTPGYSPPRQPKQKRVIDPNWRHRPRPSSRKVERPPLDEVRANIEQHGYVATGRKYGVSDNAIRKWLRTT
jgi:hypothetical protein